MDGRQLRANSEPTDVRKNRMSFQTNGSGLRAQMMSNNPPLAISRRRGYADEEDVQYLWCPMCGDKLEPTIFHFADEDADQTIWWTCRGLKTQSCDFPLWIPKDVFWTTRTAKQREENVIPLPNIHLLPPQFHPLYPTVFKPPGRRRKRKRPSSSVENKPNEEKADQPEPSSKDSVEAMPETTTEMREEALENTRTSPTNEFHRKMDELMDFDAADTSARPRFVRPPPSQRFSSPVSSVALAERRTDHVEYGDSTTRHKVKLFPDHKRALSSLISLKFAGDAFINRLNSEMSRKKLVKPMPALDQRQRIQLLMSQQKKFNTDFTKKVQEILSRENAEKELRRYLIDATKPTASTPEERQAAESAVQSCIDNIIAHQSYPLPEAMINARVGKEHTMNTSNNAEKTVNWADLGVLRGDQRAEEAPRRVGEKNPPGASVSSKESSELSTNSFPEGHPLHIKPMGDEELDNLIRNNLVGLMRTGKLKKRKRKNKQAKKTSPPTHEDLQSADPFALTPIDNEPLAYELPPLLGDVHPHNDDDLNFPSLDFYEGELDDFGFNL